MLYKLDIWHPMSTRKKEYILGRPKTKVLGYLLFIFLPFPSTENIISDMIRHDQTKISGIPMQEKYQQKQQFCNILILQIKIFSLNIIMN